MIKQPSTRACKGLMMQRDTAIIQNDSNNPSTYPAAPRKNFRRSALCTALATSLFGMAPAAMADTINNVNDTAITNSSATDQTDDTQLDMALDALRLKKAVEQGIIDQSVLDDYSEQSWALRNLTRQSQALKTRRRKMPMLKTYLLRAVIHKIQFLKTTLKI